MLYYAVNVASGPNTVTIADDHTGTPIRDLEYANVATTNVLNGTPVCRGIGTAATSASTTTS
jgi:hypothetical protein